MAQLLSVLPALLGLIRSTRVTVSLCGAVSGIISNKYGKRRRAEEVTRQQRQVADRS